MPMHQSVATIYNPEFINLEPMDINPGVSRCEIKVLYTGENRNRSFISKEVAAQMAKTLRGAPIVGRFVDKEEDFSDHGEVVIIDYDGVKFKDETKPYGFVDLNAKVWFQDFDDVDEETMAITTRTYMMTEGYLWTAQYEECKRILNNGNNQSMKLFDKKELGLGLKGQWSKTNNCGVEFFIINDAVFENLCILGEEVEPCFEGATITAPNISTHFSKNDNCVNSLFSMMEELKNTLYNKGGLPMENENVNVQVEEPVTEFEAPAVEVTAEEAPATTNFSDNTEGNSNENPIEENQETIGEFKKKNEEETSDTKSEEESDNSEEDEPTGSDKPEEKEKSEDEEKKKKYELLEQEYFALQEKYNTLESSYNELVTYKANIENEKKDALIASFFMLSDEDKKDVIEHKTEYSLDEIEAKLSVIGFRKGINFSLINEENSNVSEQEEPVNTYSLENQESNTLPAWLAAVQATKENNK